MHCRLRNIIFQDVIWDKENGCAQRILIIRPKQRLILIKTTQQFVMKYSGNVVVDQHIIAI